MEIQSCQEKQNITRLSQYMQLAIFNFNKHLTMEQLSYTALCNIGQYFPRFLYFAIIYKLEKLENKLENMRNLENISHIALGNER